MTIFKILFKPKPHSGFRNYATCRSRKKMKKKSHNFWFLRFSSVTENCFPSIQGELFVNFSSFSIFFGSVCFFRNFHLVKVYPLTFTANFGMKKSIFMSSFFGTMRVFRTNPQKISSESLILMKVFSIVFPQCPIFGTLRLF